MTTSVNTANNSLEFSAKRIFFEYLLATFYPLALYFSFLISISHGVFHISYYLASLTILSVLIFLNYERLSTLFFLVLKRAVWKISIKNNILNYYDPTLDKSFQVEIPKIKYLHKKPYESIITITTNDQRIEIDIPINSILIEIQTLLEDFAIPSIFKQRMEKKYVINKKLKEKSKFYFIKEIFVPILGTIMKIFILTVFSIAQSSSFSDNHFFFLLFYFIAFYLAIKEIEMLFKLLGGGSWEIAIINSKLIWNTPKSIEGSFVLDLSDIAYIECRKIESRSGKSSDIYYYHIQLHSGERIDLDNSSGVSLAELAPLLGDFRKNF